MQTEDRRFRALAGIVAVMQLQPVANDEIAIGVWRVGCLFRTHAVNPWRHTLLMMSATFLLSASSQTANLNPRKTFAPIIPHARTSRSRSVKSALISPLSRADRRRAAIRVPVVS